MSKNIITNLGGLDRARTVLSSMQKYMKDPSIRKKVIKLEKAIRTHEIYLLNQSNKILQNGLQEIKDPIKYMVRRLQKDERLEGLYAVTLSKDHTYLKNIASKTLDEMYIQINLASI